MKIVSAASAIPDQFVSNEAIEARLNLEAGWIERRTGIQRRPTAPPSEATSDLAAAAAARALALAGRDPKDVGLLLLATSTPDHPLPPTAPLVAHRLNLSQAGAVDVAGACAGFLYALVLAAGHAQASRKAVIVIGANLLTRRINERDPATVALFSDGAGAVLIEPSEPSCLLGFHLGSDGSLYDAIGVPAGGTREPLSSTAVQEGRHLMTIRRGSVLFKQGVQGMAAAGREALRRAGLDVEAIDWWIPHQANVRMIQDTGHLLDIPSEKTISVVEQFGNSSAATIPIALAYGVERGMVCRGQTLLFTAAGAGMLTAAAVLRW